MIFAVGDYLATPYRPLAGNLRKNDLVLAECVAHPERFLVSPRSGDPRLVLAHALTSADNAAWEVWQNDTIVGILLLDRIVWGIDARWQFVFFDDDLTSKTALLREFARRCFTEAGFHRLTIEAPEYMSVLLGFARRKLKFVTEGERAAAYHDGTTWHALVTLRLFAEDA